MKAMVLKKPAPINSSPLELIEVETPKPGSRELLVKVSACGVCRTDLHVIEGELPPRASPIIPGHQVVGTVAALGEGCHLFSVGERVGVAWLRSTCGRCEYCLSHKENLCPASLYTGYHANGGYAEYCVVREDYAYKIPETFSDQEAAPLLCAGIIGYRALKRSDLPRDGKLGIFGFGSSAHITLQIARHLGAEVFVASRDAKHQKLAKKLGASWSGGSFDKFPAKVDSAIVFAPVGELVPVALQSLKKGGTVSMAGIYMTPIPEMDYEKNLFHEKSLRSVEANTRKDGRELLEIAAEIPVKPEVQTFSLEQANEALIKLKADQINGTAVLMIM